ncbi:MAG: DUF1295 domain-containing protein [Gammaproteobacteria bacterium]|nr:DUF1295 domain-containing protein [Gammaproteobacteria bacterium]
MSQTPSLMTVVCAVWALGAIPTLIVGLLKWDPVGRLGTKGLGSQMDARWGWFIYELPALLTYPVIYLVVGNHHLIGDVALVLWLLHYGHRSLVWCWLIPKRDGKVSMSLLLSSISFNLINGGLLGWYMAFAADYPAQWLLDPRAIIGILLFVVGAKLNVWSDYRLRRLRQGSQGDRVLPSGGPFNYVCCPNLVGEIIEWVGFALLTWCLPGLAFALWTIANLVPRALWRRDWYRENFESFPKNRAALVPGML